MDGSSQLPTNKAWKRDLPTTYTATMDPAVDRLAFFHILERLKTQKRTGWIKAKIPGPESIADHMHRMSILALCTSDASLDVSKCVMMAVVHDLAEAVVGDIAPWEGISKAEKAQREQPQRLDTFWVHPPPRLSFPPLPLSPPSATPHHWRLSRSLEAGLSLNLGIRALNVLYEFTALIMFHGFELRFIALMLVSLCQGVLSLLSIANVVIANLPGSSTTLPILIVATNAPMSLAIMVIMVLDYMKRSPLSVLNEAVLCAAAGLVDLISAVTILFFSMGNAICQTRSNLAFWNACGAHFAVITLLWTATFLLGSYAACLTYVAKRYSRLHPLDQNSVWKKKVKQVHWSRASYSPKNSPGRRLRKQGPLDIESLRRVVVDKDNRALSRQMGHAFSSPLPATPSRSIGHPPALNSPAGFAERMGYFRRDAQGEYIPSTPTLRRGPPPGDVRPIPPQRVERGTIFRMQTPGVADTRRPSFPDLPNPFPPAYSVQGTAPLAQGPVDSAARSWSSSHSSANSTSSGPGFAGLGAGPEPQKNTLRISAPVPLGSPQIRSDNSPSTGFVQPPRNSVYPGSQQRPFHAPTPQVPSSAHSLTPPRRSLQPVKPLTLPASPRSGQHISAQQGIGYPRKYSLPQSSLATTVSNMPAYRPTSLLPLQTQSRTGSATTPTTLTRPAFLQPTLATLPPATMSPSTKQRVSNSAYPLPLPPLSTYPIKSVAASARPPTQGGLKPDVSSIDEPPQGIMKDRPLSVVSTVSYYSTSSASHGPQPVRELILSLTSPTRAENVVADEFLERSDSALSRRSSKSKKAPTVARSTSRHGPTSQTLWGGTGNGPARRSLASQFQQPQVRPAMQNGGR
ncbi:unnamed protein product [Rhizoctonia solani]|uniref:HD domain-containing protein n=1 Tax=Rhizoctonia solani TaxID=456999 RepID=A0A8H3I237_9AGAM|nr:unnamed protein product [Rhizoctonia solani]